MLSKRGDNVLERKQKAKDKKMNKWRLKEIKSTLDFQAPKLQPKHISWVERENNGKHLETDLSRKVYWDWTIEQAHFRQDDWHHSSSEASLPWKKCRIKRIIITESYAKAKHIECWVQKMRTWTDHEGELHAAKEIIEQEANYECNEMGER